MANSTDDLELKRRIYQAFDPAPLTADQSKLYVDLTAARGGADPVRKIEDKILLSGKPTCQVLAGHRGSGKSTELRCLQRSLEQQGWFVVLCEADEDLDRNDVDLLDLLVAILRQLASQLEVRANINLKPGYFKDRWENLKSLLGSEVTFEKLDLSAGMAKFATAIKGSPDVRLQLRKAMEPDAGNWINAANDVIGEATLELTRKAKKGLVILVDDLDKMVVRPHGDFGCSTAEYLYVHRAPQLTGLNCHVVYTMPIALAYSSAGGPIRSTFGGSPVLPMTKVRKRPPSGDAEPAGIERFREIIKRRLTSIGVELVTLGSNKVLDELIEITGGQPTELMYAVREALLESMPITQAGIDRVRQERRRYYARMLRKEHWPVLADVRQKGAFLRDDDNDKAIAELLDSRAVLMYVNDEEWYAETPSISDLRAPESP